MSRSPVPSLTVRLRPAIAPSPAVQLCNGLVAIEMVGAQNQCGEEGHRPWTNCSQQLNYLEEQQREFCEPERRPHFNEFTKAWKMHKPLQGCQQYR